MKKIYVKWGFTDDYGRAYPEDASFDWFETQEEANAFIEKMRKGNGAISNCGKSPRVILLCMY